MAARGSTAAAADFTRLGACMLFGRKEKREPFISHGSPRLPRIRSKLPRKDEERRKDEKERNISG